MQVWGHDVVNVVPISLSSVGYLYMWVMGASGQSNSPDEGIREIYCW